ncbi:MAG: endolytic transglycosylase MltG [Spirochaetes bacterium]|nr:MAG: endolytic transglycosylase MltG [Spirochaetota bacterium]RKX90418.1 MAG: endolytic transglycosylase MltG [Spirochaetota bacterium]RKX97153.1 MAG: endolytic transglycosylase MltG [Spirochaetota bacterium]
MSEPFVSVIRKILLFLLIIIPIIVILGAVAFWFILDTPPENPGYQSVEITVGKGANIISVSRQLEEQGLVNDSWYIAWRFRILSRLGETSALQSGRYVLGTGLKPSQILSSLTSPSGAQRVYTALVIPPGLTATEIAVRVQEAGLARAGDVKKAIISLREEYPVKSNLEGLQGYLFPDTYKIELPVESGIDNPESSRETSESIVRIMADRFFKVLGEVDPLWKDLTRSQLHEKVTLASIVEREYRQEDEAPKIAAVFNNRILEGMPLQSCATVVYTIEETEQGKPFQNEYLKFNRRIFERYLEIPSDYNTYFDKGLPPGPISSPGRVALEAVFYPADIDALFFVVKNPAAGTHTFTRDYKDHLAAREAYLNQFVIKD